MTKENRKSLSEYFKLTDEQYDHVYYTSVAAFLIGIYGSDIPEDEEPKYTPVDILTELHIIFTTPSEQSMATAILIDLTARLSVSAIMNFDAKALVNMYHEIITRNKKTPTLKDINSLVEDVKAFYAKIEASEAEDAKVVITPHENRRTAIAEAIERGELDEMSDEDDFN